MPLFTLDELAAATKTVRTAVAATPAYAWPLLAARTGLDVVVKHENHTAIGAFKIRGGLVYMEALLRAGAKPKGVVTATRIGSPGGKVPTYEALCLEAAGGIEPPYGALQAPA